MSDATQRVVSTPQAKRCRCPRRSGTPSRPTTARQRQAPGDARWKDALDFRIAVRWMALLHGHVHGEWPSFPRMRWRSARTLGARESMVQSPRFEESSRSDVAGHGNSHKRNANLMTLSTVDLNGYIADLHNVQREIIATALESKTGILRIPTGLESHAISLAIQACLVKASVESRGCMGNHVLIFEPPVAKRLVTILTSLSIRWRIATDGMLSAGLNLIPLAKVKRFPDVAVPIRSVGFTNNVLVQLGSTRLPIVKRLMDRAECRYLIANGGVSIKTEQKLEILFGAGYLQYVTGSAQHWTTRLKDLFRDDGDTGLTMDAGRG
jgi:hypothetical protein